jgi:very-short-patch-repair endonuclease
MALLSGEEAAQFIFRVPEGSVVALGGIDGAALSELVRYTERVPHDRRVLFVQLQSSVSVDAYVEQVIAALAETVMRMWPVWFTDVSFAICRNDTLGRQAASVIAREAAGRIPDINVAWAEAASHLALAACPPRVAGIPHATEIRQLSLAVNRLGLVLAAGVDAQADAPGALAHALEWIAQHGRAGVIALFTELPQPESSYDRILYGACSVVDVKDAGIGVSGLETRDDAGVRTWLVPWRGTPHPLSEIEQRLASMLGNDAELSGLFRFNWFVDAVRGSRPKVDLVWMEGQLVVELDGYADHATRRAFIGDRHRDYELMLSGYTVLRLANDEVVQDFGRAVEKIRDLVRLRRAQMKQEA